MISKSAAGLALFFLAVSGENESMYEPFDLAVSEIEAQTQQLAAAIQESTQYADEIHSEFIEQMDKQLIRACQFRQYELNDIQNNAVRFQQSYYGLDGKIPLGSSLVNDIDGQTVSWSLRSLSINEGENDVLLHAATRLGACPNDIDCELNNTLFLWVVLDKESFAEFLLNHTIGDYFHVSGVAFRREACGVETDRIFIVADSLVYRKTLLQACAEALGISTTSEHSEIADSNQNLD